MIDYKLFKENGIVPKKVKKTNNSHVIETENKKYLIKPKKNEIDKKFNYLISRNFNFFPNHFNIGDYDVYEYIETVDISDEEKLYEIIDLISLLHTKTTRYKNIDIDDYKIIYERLNKKINDTLEHYTNLNNKIDAEIYMSPSHYLLALNISKIYSACFFCKNELDQWYNLIKNSEKQRLAYIHNNLELNHLIRAENPYLISWDKSKLGLPIYDLIDLYNKYHEQTDFDILLNNYQKKYPLRKEELKLFFIEISIPKKIQLNKNELENTKEVNKMIKQLEKGDKLIKPYYKENSNQ